MSEVETNSIHEKISFSSDDFLLKGILHMPKNAELPPVVIGCHGLFSDSNSPKQIKLAEACNAQGIAYFRFDHRGCGDSEGNFKEVTSLRARCNDLIEAINTMRARDDIGEQLGLFGSSMGGTVCLAVAKLANPDSMVTFAAPLNGSHIIKAIENDENSDENEIKINTAKLQFDIFEEIEGIHDILIFHGDSDKIIPPSEAHRIYQKSVMPKRLIMQRNGDHNMSLKENQDKFIRESVIWYKELKEDKRKLKIR